MFQCEFSGKNLPIFVLSLDFKVRELMQLPIFKLLPQVLAQQIAIELLKQIEFYLTSDFDRIESLWPDSLTNVKILNCNQIKGSESLCSTGT